MLSAEAKNLERFVDGFVAPVEQAPGSAASNWMNMQYGDTNTLQSNQTVMNSMNAAQTPSSYHMVQNYGESGTEIWGERPSGNEWRAVAQKTSLQEWSNATRPPVQTRAPQWPQQNYHQSMQLSSRMFMQPESHPVFQENPSTASNSNEIQSFVCDLIRQNNMKKPFNLPPWIDVTQPPPPLPNLVAASPMQYEGQMHFQTNSQYRNNAPMPCVSSQPQYQVETNVPVMTPRMPATAPRMAIIDGSGDGLPRYATQTNQFNKQQAYPSLSHNSFENRRPSEDKEKPVFLNPLVEKNDADENAIPRLSEISVTNQRRESLKKLECEISGKPTSQSLTQQKNSMVFSAEGDCRGSAGETFPKQSTSDFTSASEDAVETVKITCHQLATKDFDGGAEKESRSWRSQASTTSALNKQKPFHRQPSAADLDLDWRKRENKDMTSEIKERRGPRRSYENESKKSANSERYLRQKSEENEVFKPLHFKASNDVTLHQQSKFKERKKSEEVLSGDQGGRHLTKMSKLKLLCLLQQNDELPSEDYVGKEIRNLQISDAEDDLSKFIEATQSFATNEAKMREVAEILCNKALNDSRCGRSVSILCNRLSFLMVHGTKFRNVVLNVMQGHYKNREQLYSSSFRHDKRWFGFVSFLVELFLNVHTNDGDKLHVLTDPVFSCFFQVLNSEKVNESHIDCFGHMFKQVGPTLELQCPERLNLLMEHMRDRLVLSKTPFVRRVLLHCVEIYASKWETL